MRSKVWLAGLSVLVFALALRLPLLTQRPMHTDEAVHAIKFGSLLEDGYYEYDPYEYHGPTLNYFTLLPAWLESASNLAQTNETTLRIVPVIFGVLLVLLIFWGVHSLGIRLIFIIALYTALSPALVFFSRYYIQEMLLVTFSFLAIIAMYRYLRTPKGIWMLWIGIALALMHATKETCILAWFAMSVGLIAGVWLPARKSSLSFPAIHPKHIVWGFLAALAVSVTLFSSFFSHPHGVLDSIYTFVSYLDRGTGGHQVHIYPWYQYLVWLLYNPFQNFVWSEGFIFLLGLTGLALYLFNPSRKSCDLFFRFWAWYTLTLFVIYSVIPYKTPWSMLGFYHGFIVLAAPATVRIWQKIREYRFRSIMVALFMIFFGYWIWVSYDLNYKHYAEPENPYVYGHTNKDIYHMVDWIDKMADAHPDGRDMHIDIIAPGGDYWPFPWYLRSYSRVGYWTAVSLETPLAPLMVAKPAVEEQLLHKIYEIPPPGERNLYVPLFDENTQLRAGVEMRGYVAGWLWERFKRQENPN